MQQHIRRCYFTILHLSGDWSPLCASKTTCMLVGNHWFRITYFLSFLSRRREYRNADSFKLRLHCCCHPINAITKNMDTFGDCLHRLIDILTDFDFFSNLLNFILTYEYIEVKLKKRTCGQCCGRCVVYKYCI